MRIPGVVFLQADDPEDATAWYLRGGRVGLVQQLKADPELRDVPTVVLCSGASPYQVREAWEAGSNAVVDLPPEHPGMLHRVADTLDFWLREASA
jgi:CheY-like chemotaxis protein